MNVSVFYVLFLDILIRNILIIIAIMLLILLSVSFVKKMKFKKLLFTKKSLLLLLAAVVLTTLSSLFFIRSNALATVQKNISNLQNCSKIEVYNSFTATVYSEQKTITDANSIKILTEFLKQRHYRRVHCPGAIATRDYLDVKIYKNNIQTGRFMIIAYVMEIGGEKYVPGRPQTQYFIEEESLYLARRLLGLTEDVKPSDGM